MAKSEFEKDVLGDSLVLSLSGQSNEAISKIDEFLEMEISDAAKAVAHWIKGVSLKDLGRLSDAEPDFVTALELNPMLENEMMCLTAWENLSQISEERGEYTAAINYLQAALTHLHKYDPPNIPVIALAHYAIATFYVRQVQNIPSAAEKALVSFRKVMDLDPEYPEPLAFIGALYLYGVPEQDLQKAKKCYSEFLHKVSVSERSIDPENREHLIDLAKERLNELEEVGVETEAEKEKKEEGCFIATAVHGSATMPDVIALRKFRDMRLKRTRAGRYLLYFYGHWSPPLALAIASHPLLCGIIRRLIITPFAWIARRLLPKPR